MMRLFHVSETADITRFEPRPAPASQPDLTGEMVWALEERLLHNYLVPRDCPRVTFYASEQTTEADRQRFWAHSTAAYIVAVENRWLPRLQQTTLYLYQLPPKSFVCEDEGAGHYISRTAVEPLAVQRLDNLLLALSARDVEVRLVPSLWPLYDAVVASTVQFSIIRMRNAAPRPAPQR